MLNMKNATAALFLAVASLAFAQEKHYVVIDQDANGPAGTETSSPDQPRAAHRVITMRRYHSLLITSAATVRTLRIPAGADIV